MTSRLWRALVPSRVRQAVHDHMRTLIAQRIEPLEAAIAACAAAQQHVLTRLNALEDRANILATEVSTVRESVDYAERVAVSSLSSRVRALEQKVAIVETVEARILHNKVAELRRDLDLLGDDARRMFEYWEVRTDNIYASLVSRLPELARPENET